MFYYYLSDVKDVSDITLSIIFAFKGLAGIVFGLLLGNFADCYGIRLSLLLGNLIHTLKYALIAINQNFYFQILIIVLFDAISISLVNPALESGIKYHTEINYRTLAISCFGSISYLAFLFSGIVIELMLTLGDKDEETFRIFFIYCAVVSLVAFFLRFFVRNHDYQNIPGIPNQEIRVIRSSGWEHTREVLILKNFWRFFTVIWITLYGPRLR